MNQTFNLRRFGLVLKLHLAEHIRTYLMGIAVLFGIWIVVLAPSTAKVTHFGESVYKLHSVMFGIIFCGTGAWLASEAFRIVHNPVRGIPFLTLPASRLEKYLVSLLIVLLFVLVFLAVFYSVEGACLSIINSRLPVTEPRYHLLDLWGPYMPVEFRYSGILVLPLFFMGSIYFTKVAFVKTSIVAFLLLFCAMFLNEYMVYQLFPRRDFYGSTVFTEVHFQRNGIWYEIPLANTPKLIVMGTLLLIVLVLWFTAYVRFNEKEL